MYVPEAFRVDRPEALRDFMRRHSFATLVTVVDGAPFATHLPLLLDAARGAHGTLLGHLARANPHWHAFDVDGTAQSGSGAADGRGPESLAIFSGPHAYVSPSWYETPVAVPTWNYTAVHAYGRPRVIEEPERVLDVLRRSVDSYEAAFEAPWRMDGLPSGYVEKLAANVVAFAIEVTRIEGKLKLSQNRSEADRRGAVDGLRRHGGADGELVAQLMEERQRT
jgi:transcriptional regulator